MNSALQGLTVANQVAFGLLALGTLADWLRHRDRQRMYLVLALLSLALLVIVGPLTSPVGISARLVLDVSLVMFVLAALFLLLFRDSIIPLDRAARWAAVVAAAIVVAVSLAANLPTASTAERTPLQTATIALLVLWWVVIIGEPVLRFAVASKGRPNVEGSRLRALSAGYAGLIAVLVVGTAAGPVTSHPTLRIVIDIVVLLTVPVLYASLSPPVWLRRLWSQPEQTALRSAMHDLLLYSPDRSVLAHRALEWGVRLVGGVGAFVVDSDGSILATWGMTDAEAQRIEARPVADPSTVVLPLDLEQGQGAMTILAGRFIPVFGEYELNLLSGYAVSVTAGLDRVSLTARIASLEKAKTEFLSIASHELRAPMTVIKGYLTMIAAGSLGDLPPKAMSIMPVLIARSDEVTAMLEQMIEASRLEDGKLALKKERRDVIELTDAALEALEPLPDGRELRVDMPPRPVWADVDPDRFQIVVRNLVSNAVKYSPAGAAVTVRIKPDGDTAELEVVDEGIGISAEDQLKLFRRFGRIENGATAHTSGTGLGLWLSREIARMHDGDLTVESEPGKGSAFTMEFPLNKLSQAP